MQDPLPPLTLNQLFMRDLMDSEAPCFALGYVQIEGKKTGFFALRPKKPIPENSTDQGFSFGHSVLAVEQNPVLHFAFEFYDHAIYNGLVLPSNPIVQQVISTMLETKDYFFFAINPDQTVTAFRSQLEYYDLAGLRTNKEKFGNESCSLEQYEKAVKAFSKTKSPGQVLKWVCTDNLDYLNLAKYPLELTSRP